MSQDLVPGDLLVFQLESGFGLLRVLAVDESPEGRIWHLAAYNDLFLDVEMIDSVLDSGGALSVGYPHIALTDRAFQSTQVARMRHLPLTDADLAGYEAWKAGDGDVSDRSIRLMLGLR